MKKTSRLFASAVAIAVVCLIIGLLEVFDLHPQLSVGNYHSYWVGVRKMDMKSSGTMIIPLTNGKTEIYKEYNFALIKVVHVEDI